MSGEEIEISDQISYGGGHGMPPPPVDDESVLVFTPEQDEWDNDIPSGGAHFDDGRTAVPPPVAEPSSYMTKKRWLIVSLAALALGCFIGLGISVKNNNREVPTVIAAAAAPWAVDTADLRIAKSSKTTLPPSPTPPIEKCTKSGKGGGKSGKSGGKSSKGVTSSPTTGSPTTALPSGKSGKGSGKSGKGSSKSCGKSGKSSKGSKSKSAKGRRRNLRSDVAGRPMLR